MNAHTSLYTADSRLRHRLPGGVVGGLILLILTALLVVILVGCGSSDSTRLPSSTTLRDPGASLGMLAPPGLYDLEGGRTQALGVLVYRDIEGGFWAVVDALPDQSTDDAMTLAVLTGADGLGVDLQGLQGSLVTAEGTLRDGVSTRMAGPELAVDTLKEATDTVVVTDTVAVPSSAGTQ